MNDFPSVSDLMSAEERANLFRAIIDSSLDAIISADDHGLVMEWSRSCEEIFGYSAAEAVGRPLDELIIPPQYVQRHRDSMAKFRETGGGNIVGRRIEIQAIDKAGEQFPVELALAHVRVGGKSYFTARLRNISERKRFERQILLVASELDHRVKNTLAIFLAIARQTAKVSWTVVAFMESFERRVLSYQRTHDLLSASQYQGVDFRALLKCEFEPYWEHTVSLKGEDLFLPPRSALTIGMCLHEMTTNAVKHGALSVEDGRIEIQWTITETTILIDWTEMGGPDPGKATRRKGFGSQLIRTALVNDLKGSLDIVYKPTGIVARVRIPMASINAEKGSIPKAGRYGST